MSTDDIEKSCFGLRLESLLNIPENDEWVPLEILVVSKVMEEGQLGYRIYCTPNLGTVDALGMMDWAELMLKTGIVQILTEKDDE